MEVHHHPHVGKKSIKEYLLEGLMIFLAVSMGFLAENIREIIQKHERERELIVLLRDDLKSDTTKINDAIAFNSRKMYSIDTLRKYIYRISSEKLPDTVKRKMFYLYKAYTGNVGFFIPTIRAITLLDKGDAFTLIKKQVVSDSILAYKEMNDRSTNQYETFRQYQVSAKEVGQQIFDPVDGEDFLSRERFPLILSTDLSINFLQTDKKITYIYGAYLMDCRGILFNYIRMLKQHKERAGRLIEMLDIEYNLEKE
ncbi:MAG: hypothetical protein B7Y19_08845 [Sphingobacteriales bacterium 24-40-4]|nr:MAG: hypothetical protein B7Y19_08845 [Sphingobacteriales bacterium 24-40-4]